MVEGGRKPSDPHHLRHLQPRALGRKASDEFVVPLCCSHHRAVHRAGDERAWWQTAGVDKAARKLWKHARVNEERIRLERTIRASIQTVDRQHLSDRIKRASAYRRALKRQSGIFAEPRHCAAPTQSSASKVRYSTNSACRSNRPAGVPRRLGANQSSMLSRRASHCTAIPRGARTGTAG